MTKKKLIISCAAAGILLLAAILGVALGHSGQTASEEIVYVSSVQTVTGQGSLGIQQRFSGVVEPQETYEVELQPDKSVKEVLVKEGQEVIVGTPLFIYDTAQTQSELDQAELDVDRMENEILNLKNQITTLQNEKRYASSEESLNYTTQIQAAENEIKKTEYSILSKNMEIEQLKYSLENATIVSEAAGIVKSIKKSNSGEDVYYEAESGNAFITILGTGALRVKGSVNEQNIYSVMEGAPVIIRSRVDDSIWYGTMGAVDTENAEIGNQNGYYYEMEDPENQSSKYPFYVNLDSDEGLMLGQHVYIEMDMGQEEEKTGLWLPDYFICDIDSKPYVWADNGKGKLEKKSITLGEYNPDLMEYEILDGISAEDAITFPEESLKEGLKTEFSADGSMGLQVPMDDMLMDDTALEGGEL